MWETAENWNGGKSMKSYFVKYWENFANTYHLAWTEKSNEDAALAAGYEKISRKKAIELCAAERQRRKDDYNFSGYSDSRIFPLDMTEEEKIEFYTRLKGFKTNDGYVYVRA